MSPKYEETVEYYKKMNVHPSGIHKNKISQNAEQGMTDADLEAFYSERYANVDVADFLKNERKERLFGLCNLVRKGEFFLDVGCADGGHMDVLYQRDIQGIGLDVAVTNILRGRIKYPYLKFIHGFAEEIPFSDNYFDIVLLGDVIEHFRNPQAVLSECLRVARTGVVICVPIKEEITEEHINPFSVDKMLFLLDSFKLEITYYDPNGKKITKESAISNLEAFPWLLIRAEKSEETDEKIKFYRKIYSIEIENRGKFDLLENDQWKQGNFHSRDSTEIARFNLVSHLIEGNRVLEIGAGNGDSTLALSNIGCNAVGVDLSETGIRDAFHHSIAQGIFNQPKFLIMDATSLAFHDNTFDTVIIPEVLEHVKSSRKILQEAIRVVRNGGRIIFSVPEGLLVPWNGHLRVFFKDTLATEFSQYCETISWHDLPFAKWIIGSFFVKKEYEVLEKGSIIDILMPTYNGRSTIEPAIRSVMNQTYRNWKLIIINDGGEDVKDIVDKFLDTRISYIITEHQGKSHALNIGLQNSLGGYITYLDDDDILYPIHLEELLKGVQETGAEFVYSDWFEVSYDNKNREFKREVEFRRDVIPYMLITQNYINHKCILHSRKLLKETGGYDENLSVLIDWDMIRRLAFKAKPIHIWSFTSERIRYFDNETLTNRITSLWLRDKQKAMDSVLRIVDKTDLLKASGEDLTLAVKSAMKGFSYYNYPLFQELTINLQIRENQIHSFWQEINEKNLQLEEINRQHEQAINHVRYLEEKLVENNQKLLETESNVQSIAKTITAKDQRLQELNTNAIYLEQKISSLETSITVQITRMFHSKVIERFFPQRTKRREYYDLGLKGGRILCENGWKNCIKSFKDYQSAKKTERIFRKEMEKFQIAEPEQKTLKISLEEKLTEHLDHFLSLTYKRLIFPKFESPAVSIIILTFNKAAYTYQCLESLLENTDIPYEIILVDNQSTDETGALLKKVENIVQILNKENFGFIIGCNEGEKKANGKYLLFLNNDTVVTKNWLSRLVATLENHPGCGAVGGKLVWPGGQLQEAGSIIFNDGSALGYGRGDDPIKSEYSYVREVDFTSGACLLIRTDLFVKLKGFDERYIPAYYEDADLCLGLKNLGFCTVYQPEVTIFHYEFTSSTKEDAKKYMINNQFKFVDKWKDLLKTKENNSPDKVLKARDSRKTGTILYLDDRIPASNQGCGYPRANRLLAYLGEEGFKVTIFPLAEKTPWQPYTSQFQQMGIEVLYGNALDFSKFAKERSNFYDIVIISRPHNFEKTVGIIKKYFPEAYLIYDAEALFSTREILKANIEGIVFTDDEINKIVAKEIELMRKADCIITVSDNEKRSIIKNSGLSNIFVFGHPIDVQKNIPGYETRNDILFVGSFLAQNGPNDDAVIYFIKEIWPEVQKKLSCKLYVVGINPPDPIQKLASSTVIITGYVPDVRKYYDSCRIFVVPHRYAAGIPLKLIEAMSYGIPSVVSELIGSQLNLNDSVETCIAKDVNEFVEKIIQLYQNKTTWEKVQRESGIYIQEQFNSEKSNSELKKLLESARDKK